MRLSFYTCTHQGNTKLEREGTKFVILVVYFCNAFTKCLIGQSQQGAFMALPYKFLLC